VSYEDVLSIPGFAESWWEYKYETDEWIPVFHYVGTAPITDFIDHEPKNSSYENAQWCTPKGFPREQYDYRKG